jgi:ubiquinone/menaquinone biosynthesis C-methylase UbiE
VLDIGGKKENRRGEFIPPYDQVDEWLFLNNDKTTNPDILSNLPNVPLEDNSVDIVICTEVIEYIYDYKKLLSEVHRVLKVDGVFILSSPLIYTIHADSMCDYYRFTESLIRKEIQHLFRVERFRRMGGVFAVVYDIVRGYLSYQSDRTFLIKASFRVWLMLSRVFKIFDKAFFKNNHYINTGYFLIVVKE